MDFKSRLLRERRVWKRLSLWERDWCESDFCWKRQWGERNREDLKYVVTLVAACGRLQTVSRRTPADRLCLDWRHLLCGGVAFREGETAWDSNHVLRGATEVSDLLPGTHTHTHTHTQKERDWDSLVLSCAGCWIGTAIVWQGNWDLGQQKTWNAARTCNMHTNPEQQRRLACVCVCVCVQVPDSKWTALVWEKWRQQLKHWEPLKPACKTLVLLFLHQSEAAQTNVFKCLLTMWLCVC